MCMGYMLMVFFCIAQSCTSLETAPYRTQAQCDINRDTAIDAIMAVEGITFFSVRCEAVVSQ
jgi:hypothetical protein